ASQSSRFAIPLAESPLPAVDPFLLSTSDAYVKAWTGKVNEAGDSAIDGDFDLNGDAAIATLSVAVLEKADGSFHVCVDRNSSGKIDSSECIGTFSATGEYTFWNTAQTFALTAEFDPVTAT